MQKFCTQNSLPTKTWRCKSSAVTRPCSIEKIATSGYTISHMRRDTNQKPLRSTASSARRAVQKYKTVNAAPTANNKSPPAFARSIFVSPSKVIMASTIYMKVLRDKCDKVVPANSTCHVPKGAASSAAPSPPSTRLNVCTSAALRATQYTRLYLSKKWQYRELRRGHHIHPLS